MGDYFSIYSLLCNLAQLTADGPLYVLSKHLRLLLLDLEGSLILTVFDAFSFDLEPFLASFKSYLFFSSLNVFLEPSDL